MSFLMKNQLYIVSVRHLNTRLPPDYREMGSKEWRQNKRVATTSLTCIKWIMLPWGVQYRHLIPEPVDRTSASDWLYNHTHGEHVKKKLNTSMTHVACKSEYVQLWLHPCIHACKLGVNRAGGCVFMPGLLTHLVQELNVGTVWS